MPEPSHSTGKIASEAHPRIVREGQVSFDDLPAHAAQLKAAVLRIEHAWRLGRLERALCTPEVRGLLDQRLIDSYRRIAASGVPPTPLRERTFGVLLSDTMRMIEPPAITHSAEAVMFQSRKAIPDLTFHIPGEKRCSLRADQLISLRHWGIAIRPREQDLHRSLGAFLYTHCLSELNSLVTGLHRMSKSGARLNEAEFVPCREDHGFLFERLVLDILNEHGAFAHHAPVDEDLLEKTDLRFRHPGIQRPRGARLQLSFSSSPSIVAQKAARILNEQEFVIVAPATLAAAIHDRREDPAFAHFNFDSLWQALPGKPATTEEVGRSIKGIFKEALSRRLDHPWGPAAHVPAPLRQFILQFVAVGAFETMQTLRAREQLTSQHDSNTPKHQC